MDVFMKIVLLFTTLILTPAAFGGLTSGDADCPYYNSDGRYANTSEIEKSEFLTSDDACEGGDCSTKKRRGKGKLGGGLE